mgnify:CR=1 FL=1
MTAAASGAHSAAHSDKAGAALDRLIEAGSALWAQAVQLVMTQPVLGWALVCAGLLIFGNLIRYRLPMLGGLLQFFGNLGLIVGLIAAPEGIKAMQTAHPDIDIFTAAIDDHLNERAYIVPGLGDAGDRLFGTKN